MADNGAPPPPPAYDDVLKASAPPPDGRMSQPPYPLQEPQQPGYGPYPPQAQGYPALNPNTSSNPNTYNYGVAPAQAVYPSYQQGPPQIQMSGNPGQYNYAPVTVVSPQVPMGVTTVGAPVAYGPYPAVTTNQLLAHQRSRRRMCIITICLFAGVIGFGILMMIIMNSTH